MGWSPDSEDQITFGGVNVNDAGFLASASRVGVIVTNIDGLIDQPPIRVEDKVRPGQHGARAGALKLAARPFTMEGVVFGAGRVDLETRKSALQEVLIPDGVVRTLAYTHPSDGAQIIDSRVQDPLAWGDPYEFGPSAPQVAARWHVGMVAHDPRRYSSALDEAYTGAITLGSGLMFPIVFPLTFDTELDGANVTVPAAGSFDRPATIRMYGPATNPEVSDPAGTSGLRVAFQGLAISEAEVIVVDTDEQTAAVYAVSGADYHRIVTADSPVAYWRCDDTSATINDAVGAYPGTWSGGYTTGVEGLVNVDGSLGISLNGTAGTYGTIPYNAALNPAQFTISAIIKPATIGATQYIFDCVDTTNFDGFRLAINSSGNVFCARGTGAAVLNTIGTTVLSADSTYHVAATFDGTDVRVYVNGVQDAQSLGVTYVPNPDQQSRIGATAPAGSSRFSGTVDEVALYSSALSATRIGTMYDAGSTALGVGTNAYPYLDFDTLVWANMPASGATLYYRAQIITDPAFMEVDTRAAWV